MKAIAILAATTVAGSVATSDFRYTRALPDAVATSRVAFEPDGRMIAHSKPGFADLRIVDADGNQVPWRRVPEAQLEPLPARLLNVGRQGSAAFALADLGPRPGAYERIELDLEGDEFVGRVVVSGSDRRAGPFTRLSTTKVFDVTGATTARSTTALLPSLADYRYLELHAEGVTAIRGAFVLAPRERAGLVRRRQAAVRGSAGARSTVFVLDFGIRGVPVSTVEIESAVPRYDRPVTVEGSNDRAAWVPVGAGRVTRAPGELSPPIAIESRFRYLRVTIENGDDPPLSEIMIETFGPSFALMVDGGHPPPLRLYYGSASTRAPSYEFARLPAARPTRVLDPSQLPPETTNEAFEVPGEPFGERYRWLVQVALALAALVVAAAGFLAFRRRAES